MSDVVEWIFMVFSNKRQFVLLSKALSHDAGGGCAVSLSRVIYIYL